MSFNYFEADSHVTTYNKFRPSPPKSLVERMVEFTLEKVSEPLEFAVDVGCGSGQSTEVLAPFFKKVLGLDNNEKIIKEANKNCNKPNVFYSVSPAEKMDIKDESVNLVTVGQALHWLDIPKFYFEADRILSPQGVLAVYGYKLPKIIYNENKELASIIENYYMNILQDYTLPQSRNVYLNTYNTAEFCEVYFVEGKKMKREDNFILETEGNLNDVLGYITSWSAFQNYVKKTDEEMGKKLLNDFKEEFQNLIKPHQNSDLKFKIKFNYFLLLGRKK